MVFDFPAALVRINCKPLLLCKLILMFHETYANAVPELRGMLAVGNYEEAERLAHSLNGVAGTLEAGKLSEVASAVEHALSNGQTQEVDSLINALEDELTLALAVAASLHATGVAAPSLSFAQPNLDHGEIAATLAELRGYIAGNNLTARNLFARLSGNIATCGADAEVSELGIRLDRLDFQGALPVLDGLIAKLGLQEKKTG